METKTLIKNLEELGFTKVSSIKTTDVFGNDDSQISFTHDKSRYTTFNTDLVLLMERDGRLNRTNVISICK